MNQNIGKITQGYYYASGCLTIIYLHFDVTSEIGCIAEEEGGRGRDWTLTC